MLRLNRLQQEHLSHLCTDSRTGFKGSYERNPKSKQPKKADRQILKNVLY